MNFKSLFAFLALTAFALFHCSESEEPGIDQLSDEARNFLMMRFSGSYRLETTAANVINRSFTSALGPYYSGGRTVNGPNSGSDSTLIDDPWNWETCAEVTETENEDGSITTIRDYGDGCEEGWGEFKYWMFGKLIETYRYLCTTKGTKLHSDYFYDVIYDRFGGRYNDDYSWLMDGRGRYDGWAEWDTVNHRFSGEFTHADNIEHEFNGNAYGYSSEGSSSYSEKAWEQAAGGFYQYTEGENFYRSDILKKLVMRFDCFNEGLSMFNFAMVYTSGIEKITYNQNGRSGEFLIDYGDGSCDSIIYVIENGRRVRINFNQLLTLLSRN